MKYSIGLDIGTASVGWAVINKDKDRIEDLGVRLFESAENQKDGSSLALPRREARSMRRRLSRRKHRLERMKNVFIDTGLLRKDQIQDLHSTPNDVYSLRHKALREKLTAKELFLVCFHIAKRRGYKSNRKKIDVSESDKAPDETKKVLSNIEKNKEALKEYQTVGEMLYHSDVKRNKADSYAHSVSREMLHDELETILEKQRGLGNTFVTEDVQEKIVQAFAFQRPFASGEQLRKLVGPCQFEDEEIRAAKATYRFQLFSALQKINHLRVIDGETREERSLSEEERENLLVLAHKNKNVTYKGVRRELKLSEKARLNGVNYFISQKPSKVKKEKDPEDVVFVSMAHFYDIRKTIQRVDEVYWESVKDDRGKLDGIGEALTFYKTDEDITKELEEYDVPRHVIEVLLTLSFTKVGHLSRKALAKIIPYLEQGKTYDKACTEAGYDFAGVVGVRTQKLPPLDVDDHSITNPVVKRALSQVIKVVNAIVGKYGSPDKIHVEFARELSKNAADRKRIERDQKENQKGNADALKKIEELYGVSDPGGFDLIKYRLWQEQGGKCMYSLKPIDESRLFEDGYTEVDHIIPHSRSFDDSFNNKVLVLSEENRQKGNALPYEYFGDDEARWDQFAGFVSTLSISPKKRANLLLKKFKLEGLTTRTLNDTRFIAKYTKNYIEKNLWFDGMDEEEKKRHVFAVNGSTTAYLRRRWGVRKIREANMLHHAADAVVIAVTTPKMVRDVAYYSKKNEVSDYLSAHKKLKDFEDLDGAASEDHAMQVTEKEAKERLIARHEEKTRTLFPTPWKGFRDELEARLSDDPQNYLNVLLKKTNGYKDEVDLSFVTPVFVSRMPRRKVTGRAHEETLRSPKLFDEGRSTVKTPLSKLTLKNLENMRGKQSDRRLYETLKSRLEEHDGDAQKAFREPIYKPQKSKNEKGERVYTDGPQVRSVTLVEPSQKSGILVNEGKALTDQDSMVRVDVFSQEDKKGKKKYYLIPIYTYHFAKKELPKKVIVAGKRENEWPEIDDTYEFEFSLYRNDLVKLVKKKDEKAIFGYYAGCNRFTASVSVTPHDSLTSLEGKGVKSLYSFEKYIVDILGNYHKVGREKRQGVTKKK